MASMETPFVSFFIVFYNQEKFVKDAIEAAFNQTYQNLEIILSDDCSTDSTFQIIEECVKEYKGPHKVLVNRNTTNMGLTKHMNKCLYELCQGEIIFIGGGDDISKPERISESVKIMQKHPNVMSLSTEVDIIDGNGVFLNNNMENHIVSGGYALMSLTEYVTFKDFFLFPGASRAIRRKVLEAYPPLDTAPDEDINLFVRSIMLGDIAFIHEPLLLYRRHETNITKLRSQKGGAANDVRKRQIAKEAYLNQFAVDLDYAIKHNYVKKEFKQQIWNKLKRSFDEYISVPQFTIIQRVFSKLIRIVSKMFGLQLSVTRIMK